jgi:hypothetical protein
MAIGFVQTINPIMQCLPLRQPQLLTSLRPHFPPVMHLRVLQKEILMHPLQKDQSDFLQVLLQTVPQQIQNSPLLLAEGSGAE